MPATTSDGVVDAHVRPARGDDPGELHHSGAARRPSQPVSRTAVNAAALAWPDGNDDVSGRRTG